MTLNALIEYLKELRQQRIDGTRYEVEVEPSLLHVVGNQVEIETP